MVLWQTCLLFRNAPGGAVMAWSDLLAWRQGKQPMGQRQIYAVVDPLSPKMSPVGSGCTPVPSSACRLPKTLLPGSQFLLKHTGRCNSACSFSQCKVTPAPLHGGLQPISLSFPSSFLPSASQLVVTIFLVSQKAEGKGPCGHRCHNSPWPGSS